MTTGRPATAIADQSRLDAASVDVGARSGWLLRMARLTGGADVGSSLDAFARALGVNVTRLHRVETGRVHDVGIVEGYERLVGLAPGSLDAAISITRRTFPARAVADRSNRPDPDVGHASDLLDLLESGRRDGGTWLAWATVLRAPGAVGLPLRLAEPLVDTLCSELNRSAGAAFVTRYEALSRLREGPYSRVALDAARRQVDDPGAQVLLDLVSAVSESPRDGAAGWLTDLLRDERDHVSVGGVTGLENLAAISDDPGVVWSEVIDDVLDVFHDAVDGSRRRRATSHLLRLAATTDRRLVEGRVHRPLAPVVKVTDWTTGRSNDLWSTCLRAGERISTRLGVREDLMLPRLVFDPVYSPRETHAATATMLLTALPDVAAVVDEETVRLLDEHRDPRLFDRAGPRLSCARRTTVPSAMASWPQRGPEQRDAVLWMSGGSGSRPDRDLVAHAIADGGRSARAALWACGMSADPLLEDAAFLGRHAPAAERDSTVAGAQWWGRQGSRVTDEPRGG